MKFLGIFFFRIALLLDFSFLLQSSSTAGKSDVVELVFHIKKQQCYVHVERPVLLLY